MISRTNIHKNVQAVKEELINVNKHKHNPINLEERHRRNNKRIDGVPEKTKDNISLNDI